MRSKTFNLDIPFTFGQASNTLLELDKLPRNRPQTRRDLVVASKGAMKTSENGVKIIKSFEGLELTAYPDPGTGGDPWTIGYGTTRGVTQGMVVTAEEAEELLVDDLVAYERAVMTLLPVEMTQGEFDALVSFCYNVGPTALEESTLRKRLLAGEPRCWVYQKELPR